MKKIYISIDKLTLSGFDTAWKAQEQKIARSHIP
jgi:hypothetical protein